MPTVIPERLQEPGKTSSNISNLQYKLYTDLCHTEMPRGESSGAPGPQAVGGTTFADSTRVQHVDSLLPPSDPDIIKEDSQRLRKDALQAELRGRGNVEADENMPWKTDEMRPSPGFEDPPKSFVVAYAGSSKDKSGGNNVPEDAPNGFEDGPYSVNSAANSSNVASHGSDDEPDSFNDTANGSNIIFDAFDDPVTTSWALGGANREENRPTSLSEDTNTLITSFSGP